MKKRCHPLKGWQRQAKQWQSCYNRFHVNLDLFYHNFLSVDFSVLTYFQ